MQGEGGGPCVPAHGTIFLSILSHHRNGHPPDSPQQSPARDTNKQGNPAHICPCIPICHRLNLPGGPPRWVWIAIPPHFPRLFSQRFPAGPGIFQRIKKRPRQRLSKGGVSGRKIPGDKPPRDGRRFASLSPKYQENNASNKKASHHFSPA